MNRQHGSSRLKCARSLGSIGTILVIAVYLLMEAPAVGASSANRVEELLHEWDLKGAQDAIKSIPSSSPQAQLEAAILAIHEGNYSDAVTLLQPLLADSKGEARLKIHHYYGLAKGNMEALGPRLETFSPQGHFVVRFSNPRDRLLAPYLFEALETAYVRLGKLFNTYPQERVRIEILDSPESLALLSPLSIDDIHTTGTVGITNFHRIVTVSPRVMLHGYEWLDTLVHEYVHYLVSIRSRGKAPVWLQEGLAKLFETRWRSDGPSALNPASAYLLRQAIDRDELIEIEEMHPSIAKLPSQKQAALAYAQAESMLAHLSRRKKAESLLHLIDQVASGTDAKLAFEQLWGHDFSHFIADWKSHSKRQYQQVRGRSLRTRKFQSSEDNTSLENENSFADIFDHLGGGRARQYARLGLLLAARGHKQAAIVEFEKARRVNKQSAQDPALCLKLGLLYLDLKQVHRAAPLLSIAGKADPENASTAAHEAHALTLNGDPLNALKALKRALRNNPFIPSLHCDLATLASSEVDQKLELKLCEELH